jgi:hypothetical protein
MGQIIVLLISELGWFAHLFNRFFPVLGKDFRLSATGILQCPPSSAALCLAHTPSIGAAMLSHHLDVFSLIPAWFLFSLGLINILVSLA